MSGVKDVFKGGWHPKGKDSGKESWRGDFKGINQVAGWMGKGKSGYSKETEHGLDHQSAPLSSLQDPDSFGPPPKHRAATGSSTTGSSSSGEVGSASPSRVAARPQVPARQQEPESPPSRSGPYRADTTGLSTANLPPPPVRRADGVSEPPTSLTTKPKPKLPPRLPPRTAGTAAIPSSPPPAYNDSDGRETSSGSLLNQGAVDRLGKAGVSVPSFGIGRNASPPVPPRTGSTSPPAQATPIGRSGQLGELQVRFSKMNTSSSDSASQGTSWEQKKATLKTASDFRRDPGSVTLTDARNAASTANNFRERHGEQVAAGWKAASNLNQKYGVMDKVKSYSSEDQQVSGPPSEPSSPSKLGRKAPPPPPAKKWELHGDAVEPPPVPLDSKPRPT